MSVAENEIRQLLCDRHKVHAGESADFEVKDTTEIANVLGAAGVDYMIAEGRRTPFKFNFGAPSCVPATDCETAGAELGPRAVDRLMARGDVRFLSEVMNFPGVLRRDPAVMAKIASALRRGKPVDGHAPGLRGAAGMKPRP